MDLAVKGRFYQRAYVGRWYSFQVSAKSNRVSAYQWRAPGEWFAEVYAAYYDPRQERGALLPAALLSWFKKTVKPPEGPAVGDGPQ